LLEGRFGKVLNMVAEKIGGGAGGRKASIP